MTRELHHPLLSDKPAWEGRRQFFRAIERGEPRVLAALAENVLPAFRARADEIGVDHCQWYRLWARYSPGSEEVRRAHWHEPLVAWQREFSLEAGWVSQIVVDTLTSWYRNPDEAGKAWSLYTADWKDEAQVILQPDGRLVVRHSRPPGIYITEDELLIDPALTRGRPGFEERERERLRRVKMKALGWTEYRLRKGRGKRGTPAEWLLSWQIRKWPWECGRLASLHQEHQILRKEVVLFAKLIRLPLRAGRGGPAKHRHDCPCGRGKRV